MPDENEQPRGKEGAGGGWGNAARWFTLALLCIIIALMLYWLKPL